VTEEAVVGRLLEQVEAMKMLVLRGDPEQLRRWYAPDVEVVSRHGTYNGVDAVVDRFRLALANGTFEAIRTTWSVEDDDTIALQNLVQYSSGGRLVEFETMAMLRFDDDVVVAVHEFFDVKDLERQLAAN
jgi:SnoaL-like domain